MNLVSYVSLLRVMGAEHEKRRKYIQNVGGGGGEELVGKKVLDRNKSHDSSVSIETRRFTQCLSFLQ